MRTTNIEEAKLFFVPFLLNHLDLEFWGPRKLCVDGLCNYQLLDEHQKRLRKYKSFQKYPERHVIVRSFFCSQGKPWNQKQSKIPEYNTFMEIFPKMTAIVFEARDEHVNFGQRMLSSYYVGTPCDKLYDEKPFDVAMIARTRGDYKDRRTICKWLSNSSSIKTSVCGKGARCPNLAQSKFGFHAYGDTWGSQRLMDTLMSGTVPIFTHPDQYDIQGGNWIDWNQLSYYIPVHDDNAKTPYWAKVRRYSLKPAATEESFLRDLEKIISDKEGYERRHKAVLEHIPLFDYRTLHPFDTYMYLVQADLFPMTRVAKSKFSALLLPPPYSTEP